MRHGALLPLRRGGSLLLHRRPGFSLQRPAAHQRRPVTRPTIAIAGLTACSGCQLTFFNCERELPELAERFAISYFPMGFTERSITGPIEAAFVEGAVSTPDDLEVLIKLRSRSRFLIAFGTCALWGGVAAMKNDESRNGLLEAVYGKSGLEMK